MEPSTGPQRGVERRAEGVHRHELHLLHRSGRAGADALGRFRQALPHDRRALEAAESALGPDSLYGAFANMGTGQDLLGLCRPEEAVEPLERAVERMDASAADPVELARARFALARALSGRGHPPLRARELAGAAREALAAGTRETAALRRSIDRWLEHR